MSKHGFKKGEYEEAVEHARELLGKGIGITEVMEETRLRQEDILKLQNQINEEFNDK